jgi:hypothetical protein
VKKKKKMPDIFRKRCQTFSATEPPHVAPKAAQSFDPEQINVRLDTDLTLEKPLS